jgi:hypothetical protein
MDRAVREIVPDFSPCLKPASGPNPRRQPTPPKECPHQCPSSAGRMAPTIGPRQQDDRSRAETSLASVRRHRSRLTYPGSGSRRRCRRRARSGPRASTRRRCRSTGRRDGGTGLRTPAPDVAAMSPLPLAPDPWDPWRGLGSDLVFGFCPWFLSGVGPCQTLSDRREVGRQAVRLGQPCRDAARQAALSRKNQKPSLTPRGPCP